MFYSFILLLLYLIFSHKELYIELPVFLHRFFYVSAPSWKSPTHIFTCLPLCCPMYLLLFNITLRVVMFRLRHRLLYIACSYLKYGISSSYRPPLTWCMYN